MNYFLLLATVAFMATGATGTRPTTDGSVIKVVITGGSNTGPYNLSSDKTTCSRNATGANSFGNQYHRRHHQRRGQIAGNNPMPVGTGPR